MPSLDKALKSILERVQSDLVIGSANKKADIEKTSSWSGDALDHARAVASYVKKKDGYHAQFFKLRVNSNKSSLQYVTEGANGKFGRAGNCQEHVGLALYYLFQHKELWSKIEVITLDECFDHVLLRVTSLNKTKYYFDSWSNTIFSSNLAENLKVITDTIIDGFRTMLNEARSQEETEEIQEMLDACNKISKNQISIQTEVTFYPKNSKRYMKEFDRYYQELLSQIYPSSKFS